MLAITWATNLATFLTIIGVSFTAWASDPVKAWISLSIFILFLSFLAWRLYRVSKHFMLKHYAEGYVPLSSSAKMTTSDGKTYIYEIYRHIQVKQPVMRAFTHKYTWTGTKDPKATSDLQKISPAKSIEGDTRKVITLTFPQPRIYNDVEILHLRMECDDTDQVAQPCISLNVQYPIRLISFDVELLSAPKGYFGENAKVCRKALEKGAAATIEDIAIVNFDSITKSFSYQLPNPEPGYEYFISWSKPPRSKAKVTSDPWKKAA